MEAQIETIADLYSNMLEYAFHLGFEDGIKYAKNEATESYDEIKYRHWLASHVLQAKL